MSNRTPGNTIHGNSAFVADIRYVRKQYKYIPMAPGTYTHVHLLNQNKYEEIRNRAKFIYTMQQTKQSRSVGYSVVPVATFSQTTYLPIRAQRTNH